MDKVTEEVISRVIFNNVFNRTSFGSPKLDFSARPEADEIADEIKRIRKDRVMSRNSGLVHPFGKQIGKAQMKYIARDLFIWCFDATSPNGEILKRIGHSKLNKTRFEKLNKKVRAPFARDILQAFYNREAQPSWWLLFRTCSAWCKTVDDEAKYAQRLADTFKDAIPPKDSPSTLELKFRTATVMALIREIRRTEDFSAMPILADALQDAGYDRTDLLEHYRNPLAVISFGLWIFRATGLLEVTNGRLGDGSAEVHVE